MKAGGAVIVMLVAIVLMYLAISGRFACLEVMWTCFSSAPGSCSCAGGAAGGSPIIVTPNSGANPTNAPIYDARGLLPPIQALTL